MKVSKSPEAASYENRVLHVEKDDKCFFRCVAMELLGDYCRHQDVQTAIVDFVDENRTSFTQLVDGDTDQHIRDVRHGES